MKNKSTQLVDEHLESLQGMQEVGTDDFFYTRLKARMTKEYPQKGWSLPLRPVWIISTLVLLLAVNGVILSQQIKSKTTTQKSSTSSLQNFAESYDQTISSSY